MHASTYSVKTAHVMWQWIVPDEPGLDHVIIERSPTAVHARGLLLGIAYAHPFRLRYQIECDATYQVQRVKLHVEGNGEPTLTLVREANGTWHDGQGNEYPPLTGCTEIDIEVSPITNTLPIRRLALEVGQSAIIRVVYITLPTLEFSVHRQEYTRLPDHDSNQRYLYQSLTTEFVAEIEVDGEGLVVDYPDIWKRVW
jgi:hypothetical protein